MPFVKFLAPVIVACDLEVIRPLEEATSPGVQAPTVKIVAEERKTKTKTSRRVSTRDASSSHSYQSQAASENFPVMNHLRSRQNQRSR
jgi:hypothetical protein